MCQEELDYILNNIFDLKDTFTMLLILRSSTRVTSTENV